MDVYMYQAALFCEDCGAKIRRELKAEGKAPADPRDEESYDSDDYPKGLYPDGGGEADSPQHCDECGVFLENDLTEAGREYVADMVAQHIKRGRGDKKVIQEWVKFYDIPIEESGEVDPMANPKKNAKRGPGKFSDDLDAAVYELTLDGGADEEASGEGFGWYGLLRGGSSIAQDIGETGLKIDSDEAKFLEDQAGVILHENEQGFVFADYYEDEDELEADWKSIEEDAKEFNVEEG